LVLSADHRVVDGADAALFLKEVKDLLENPALLVG
jgi:pyruvate/2-oxoglutarate dehydrogenase complex dihydrolipoamide acyltransferase (E2) component